MHYQQGHDRFQVYMTSMDQLVLEDSISRNIDLIVNEMQMEDLGFQHAKLKRQGNLPYDPKDLFKLLVYGSRNGIRSAQKLARACVVNVEVMWLMKGLHPSPRTINNFKSQNAKAIKNANRNFVKLLNQRKLDEGKQLKNYPKSRGPDQGEKKFKSRKAQHHLGYLDKNIGHHQMNWKGYIT